MIVEPEQRVPDFIKAGADIVSVHCEQSATIHLHRTLNQVLTSNIMFEVDVAPKQVQVSCITWLLFHPTR